MKYPIKTSAIIDVTKPPYCADNTGKTDCTEIICKILDDILIRQVSALRETYNKMIELSNNKKENVYIGLEAGRVQNGVLNITFPENEPSSKIVYFPKGTYLVSGTVTYSLDNLKQFWYWVPGYENCRNIHFLGESKDNTVIRLADNSCGFEAGNKKPLISFVNNELQRPRYAEGINGEYTNVAFMNTIKDITLDRGKGNPGAVGIKYVSSNCGRIDNVDIRTEEGLFGIYVDNNTSQAVFANIAISGFDYGIDTENTSLLFLDNVDVSENKAAGIYTTSAIMISNAVRSGNIPAFKFKKAHPNQQKGRYYFNDLNTSFANETSDNYLYFETETSKARKEAIPANIRSEAADDWAFVDDFGAKGDGKTDSTRAIQAAMNSGKSVVVFGEGEYFIDAKIKIPKSVKTVDFLFCSLACGIRLVGGEYDAAFEISQDSDDLLFVENLSAWENFRGHIRLVKHAAKRDAVFSNIHLMTASMYFNSVPGSKVYFDNCFLTTGTYTRNAWIPGEGFVPVYSHIIPYEFHGQKVYGRVVNPERADLAMLNDNSEVYIDGFRTEGCGTALKSINNGVTQINFFNTAFGFKKAQNPLFELKDSEFKLYGAYAFGTDKENEYNIMISDTYNDSTNITGWDDIKENVSEHGKLIINYSNSAFLHNGQVSTDDNVTTCASDCVIHGA